MHREIEIKVHRIAPQGLLWLLAWPHEISHWLVAKVFRIPCSLPEVRRIADGDVEGLVRVPPGTQIAVPVMLLILLAGPTTDLLIGLAFAGMGIKCASPGGVLLFGYLYLVSVQMVFRSFNGPQGDLKRFACLLRAWFRASVTIRANLPQEEDPEAEGPLPR